MEPWRDWSFDSIFTCQIRGGEKRKMKTKLGAVIASVVAVGLLASIIPASNAATYYGHDGSLDEYLEKVKVKKLKKGDLWVYIVRACATDHTLGVSSVILKSDSDTQVLGVNKNIPFGKCSSYGAVMKAKDGNTLGAELIEKHEALTEFQKVLESPATSKKQIQSKMEQLNSLRIMLGGLV